MRVVSHTLVASLLISLEALLCGCTATDPLYQGGHWNPTGANEMNLSAEVENPADLVSGRRAQSTDALAAAAAVDRLRRDQVKPLPDTGTMNLQTSPAAPAADTSPVASGGL